MAQRPPSFDVEVMWDWGPWVLEHGLPELPLELGLDEGLPVAVFTSQTRAAVLFVYHCVFEGEAFLDCEAVGFRRVPDRWEEASGSGGGDWNQDFRLARPADLGPRETRSVGSAGCIEHEWSVMTPYGVAGSAAATIEVEQRGTLDRSPITSPIGAWIAATDGQYSATVRIKDATGVTMFDTEVPDARMTNAQASC